MARIRVFQSGDSQVVHIPDEIAYADPNIEVEITRIGDIITICPAHPPARKNLKEVVPSSHAPTTATEPQDRIQPRKTDWD